jgi:hypothetical protein
MIWEPDDSRAPTTSHTHPLDRPSRPINFTSRIYGRRSEEHLEGEVAQKFGQNVALLLPLARLYFKVTQYLSSVRGFCLGPIQIDSRYSPYSPTEGGTWDVLLCMRRTTRRLDFDPCGC